MDKFGIFKLLNSFFDFSSNSKSQNSESSERFDEQISGQSNPLSDILSAFSSQNNPTTNPTPQVNKPQKQKPLQSQMLSTMYNHQQIVNRVNKIKQK